MFEVRWLPNAERELEVIYIATRIDLEMLRAQWQIDELLATKPLAVGRWRTSSVHRLVIREPLAVEYEVILDDLRVIVHSVFLIG